MLIFQRHKIESYSNDSTCFEVVSKDLSAEKTTEGHSSAFGKELVQSDNICYLKKRIFLLKHFQLSLQNKIETALQNKGFTRRIHNITSVLFYLF